MPRSVRISLAELLSGLDELPTTPDPGRWGGWDTAPTSAWRALLRSVPTDRRAFEAHFDGVDWDDTLDTLSAWAVAGHGPARLRGRLGVLALTLQSLDHSQRYRRRQAPGHDCDTLCRRLMADAEVRGALLEAYAPDGGEARREWDGIDPDTLAFHRHGTTSFIVTGAHRHGGRHRFALKCLLLPYLEIPAIERATRDYISYRRDVPGLVRLWASHDSWVLMDFVPGVTLAERLAAEPRSRRLRLDLLERYGTALFGALDALESAGLSHDDLSPSNIIVADHDGGVTLTLLDFGVNYLHRHALPGENGPDYPYVAPEVRDTGQAAARTDLYSIGQLLVYIGTGAPAAGGVVPDEFYAETPLMARFLEDLLDAEPARRLMLFQPAPGPLYPQLSAWFAEELAALRAAYAERLAPASDLRDTLMGLVRPFSGALNRQWRLWRVRRRQRMYEAGNNMRLPWLLGWSIASAVLFYLSGLLVTMYLLRNLRLGFGGMPMDIYQRITHSQTIPVLDGLRAADYRAVDPGYNVPMLAVAFTFVLVCAKYYQALFAGLTPLTAGRRPDALSVLAEVAMRITVVFAPIAIAVPVIVERRWWLFSVASGMTLVLACNAVVAGYAKRALRRAREAGLSTVPERVLGVEKYTSWLIGNALYAILLWTLAPLLYLDKLGDTLVYMIAVIIVNVPQMYVIKCGIEATGIRVGLGRAYLAAERLRALRPAILPQRPVSGIPVNDLTARSNASYVQ